MSSIKTESNKVSIITIFIWESSLNFVEISDRVDSILSSFVPFREITP
jgi:hypothetical protein